eukprot:Amastigsp_a175471_127.p3 type:complete len:144 gc:universal Amastigsp_a175471_127:1587-1156(-)
MFRTPVRGLSNGWRHSGQSRILEGSLCTARPRLKRRRGSSATPSSSLAIQSSAWVQSLRKSPLARTSKRAQVQPRGSGWSASWQKPHNRGSRKASACSASRLGLRSPAPPAPLPANESASRLRKSPAVAQTLKMSGWLVRRRR